MPAAPSYAGYRLPAESPLGKGYRIVIEARSQPMEAKSIAAAETWVSVSQSTLRRRAVVKAPMLCSTYQRFGRRAKPSANSGCKRRRQNLSVK